MMNNWDYLKAGDIIDIVATAPGVPLDTLTQDLHIIKGFLNHMGLKARVNYNIISQGAKYFDNEAQEIRQQDLIKALKAEDSKAIWFYRGGYGTAKLLAAVSEIDKPKKPKLLIGFSDLNCIHLWVNKFWQWPSLHYRNLCDFAKRQDYKDFINFKNIIFGNQEQIEIMNLTPINKAAKQIKEIKAVVTGGTCQVIQSGIGLSWQLDPTNKILFLEELFDRGARIDRTLNHFKELKLFDQVKAIIFGDIICGLENNGEQHCDMAISHFARNIDIPVLSVPNIGHDYLNYPLPLNTESTLNLNDNSSTLFCKTGGIHVK